MPTYIYNCEVCGSFEQKGRITDESQPCPSCSNAATRNFCSGIPYLKGETVDMPQEDRLYKQHKELKDSGWDLDHAMTHIRKGIQEDKEGRHTFNPKQADTAEESVRMV